MASIQIKVPNWLDRICVWPPHRFASLRPPQDGTPLHSARRDFAKRDMGVFASPHPTRWDSVALRNAGLRYEAIGR